MNRYWWRLNKEVVISIPTVEEDAPYDEYIVFERVKELDGKYYIAIKHLIQYYDKDGNATDVYESTLPHMIPLKDAEKLIESLHSLVRGVGVERVE